MEMLNRISLKKLTKLSIALLIGLTGVGGYVMLNENKKITQIVQDTKFITFQSLYDKLVQSTIKEIHYSGEVIAYIMKGDTQKAEKAFKEFLKVSYITRANKKNLVSFFKKNPKIKVKIKNISKNQLKKILTKFFKDEKAFITAYKNKADVKVLLNIKKKMENDFKDIYIVASNIAFKIGENVSPEIKLPFYLSSESISFVGYNISQLINISDKILMKDFSSNNIINAFKFELGKSFPPEIQKIIGLDKFYEALMRFDYLYSKTIFSKINNGEIKKQDVKILTKAFENLHKNIKILKTNLYKYVSKKLEQDKSTLLIKYKKSQIYFYIISILEVLLLILFLVNVIGFIELSKNEKKLKKLLEVLMAISKKDESEFNIDRFDLTTNEGIQMVIELIKDIIDELQESMQKIEESAKAKSLFLANMSHEIRTPLNGILGFLELLRSTELDEEQLEAVDTIEESAKNLLEIVNKILDVSKIESNKVELEFVDFDFVDKIESVVEIFATPAANKDITYSVYISPDFPSKIKADQLKIVEILNNLINNAMKFTDRGGQVTVTIENKGIVGGKVRTYFEVADTGRGMTEDQKKKVFEAFTQADNSVTRKYGGTGLGLTLVKSYVELMGGEIQVDSRINKGTKFYFTVDLDIVDPTPKYESKAFDRLPIYLISSEDSVRIQNAKKYFDFFGVNITSFNITESKDAIELARLKNQIFSIFYQELSPEHRPTILREKNNFKAIFLPYSKREELLEIINSKDLIDKIETIFDPATPSKIFNSLSSLKRMYETSNNTKVNHNKEEKTAKQNVKENITEQKQAQQKEMKKEYKDMNVLVAEDNIVNQKYIKRVLQLFGISSEKGNLEICENGAIAIRAYMQDPEKYDLILMDINMPEVDGVEALHQIREFEEDEGLPKVPIITITANALPGDEEKFKKEGFDDYLSKPVNKNRIEEVLKKVLRGEYASQDSSFDNNLDESNVFVKENKDISENITIWIPIKNNFIKSFVSEVLSEKGDNYEIITFNVNEMKSLPKGIRKMIKYIILDAEHVSLVDDAKEIAPNAKVIAIGEIDNNSEYKNKIDEIITLDTNELKNVIK